MELIVGGIYKVQDSSETLILKYWGMDETHIFFKNLNDDSLFPGYLYEYTVDGVYDNGQRVKILPYIISLNANVNVNANVNANESKKRKTRSKCKRKTRSKCKRKTRSKCKTKSRCKRKTKSKSKTCGKLFSKLLKK